jgi:hypothetical protein
LLRPASQDGHGFVWCLNISLEKSFHAPLAASPPTR